MRRRSIQFVFVVLLIGIPLTLTGHTAASDADPSWSALMGSMTKMHVAMSAVKPSGNSEVDFVALMLPHHQAAIDMAKSELLNGTDPQIRRLAQEIITDQQSEIELMQLWLRQNPTHRR